MRTILVTGGAGFIGRAVVDRLLTSGDRVHVVDRAACARTRAGLDRLRGHPAAGRLRLVRADLAEVDVAPLVAPVDAVVHLAGQPGVQTSWGSGFGDHVRDNVLVTQRLLEAALTTGARAPVLLASSSSVLGDAPDGPLDEHAAPSPLSPYGVTKATLEQLAGTYAARGVATTALRFFTVYGRHQRPDMAVARMCAALTGGPPFPLRGDGSQQRDWTHVDDIADGVLAALGRRLPPGTTCNLGSGRPVSLREVVRLVGELAGRPVPLTHVPAVPGDPSRTWADTTRAATLLDHRARVDLRDGLRDQLAAAGVTPVGAAAA